VLTVASLPPIGPESIVASRDAIPLGIRSGQTLFADKGSIVPDHFNAGPGSTVIVDAGAVVGRNLEASGAAVTISGGSIGAGLDAFHGGLVTISGGTFGDTFSAYADSEIHLLGTEFTFADLPIDGLVDPGDSIVLDQRDAPLAGRFLDGNLFRFDLNSTLMLPEDYFDPQATVRLSLSTPLPQDCDFDDSGSCEVADIDRLLAALGSTDPVFDLDGSGTVDDADIDAWLASAGQKSVGRPFAVGDATLDGAVDSADLNVVGAHWLSAVSSWSHGDFNGDGRVNAIDLDAIGQNWLQNAPAAQAVPEPTGFVLVLVGFILLGTRLKSL
jgi:hypothetical protein